MGQEWPSPGSPPCVVSLAGASQQGDVHVNTVVVLKAEQLQAVSWRGSSQQFVCEISGAPP